MSKCNKLFKEALEFLYKLDEEIYKITDKQKFTPGQLRGYLIKRGVSPKEIDASRLWDNIDNKPITGLEWKHLIEYNGKHKLMR